MTSSMRVVSFAGAVALALSVAPPAFADRAYAVAGAKSVAVTTLDASTSLAAPTSGGPYPLVVASHGFSASGDNQLGWAKHFASWGFVVAVPTFPTPFAPDTAKNAAIIEDLVSRLRGPLAAAHAVSTGPFGLEGHSAGGLATTVAALALTPGATVLFDPVDKDDVGKAAYATLCGPVLGIFAGPSSCNNNAGWRPFAKTTTAEVIAFDVKGSTHCDGENAARGLCGPVCGGAASAERQAAYAHYATAFLLSRLANDAAATAALADATVAADADLASPSHGATTCAKPGGDAGPVVPDGGSTSSSSSSGASGASGGAAPTPMPAGDAPAASDSSGCGCRVTPSSASGSSALLALAALAAAVARRRR
jgi:MYXO-CTERM domain-containing protein